MQIHIARDGQELGIYSPDTLINATTDGVLEMTDHAWVDGESNWLLLPEFARKFSIALPEKSVSTPPPPPKINASEIQNSPSNTPSQQTDYCCPKCESHDTKRIKLLYEGGKVKSHGTAESHSRGTVQVSSTSTTALAERYSPPNKVFGYFSIIFQGTVGAILYTFIMGAIVKGLLGLLNITNESFIGGIIGIAYFISIPAIFILYFKAKLSEKKKAEIKYDRKLQAWNELMTKGCLCSRCGHEFMI
jgi:hypothetical protein